MIRGVNLFCSYSFPSRR